MLVGGSWRWFCVAVAVAVLSVVATPAVHGEDIQRQRPVCGGHPATIVGTSQHDVLTGTRGRDFIVGLGGPDRIFGRGGRDILCGGRSSDHLYGGRDVDRLFGGTDRHYYNDPDVIQIGDTLSGGPGDDHIFPGRDRRGVHYCEQGVGLCTYPDRLSFEGAERGVTVRLNSGQARGEGHDTFIGHRLGVVGSRFSDHVWGNEYRNSFDLGQGADVVQAMGGRDWIRVDPEPLRLRDQATDTVWAGAGSDGIETKKRGVDSFFYGGDGYDWLSGSSCSVNTCVSIEAN